MTAGELCFEKERENRKRKVEKGEAKGGGQSIFCFLINPVFLIKTIFWLGSIYFIPAAPPTQAVFAGIAPTLAF